MGAAAAPLPPTQERVLLVRLPCNPIFPIGPIYLADHLHKCFPSLPQRILDLAALPVLDVERVLQTVVDQFRPTLLVFSWRDIQIYAPVDCSMLDWPSSRVKRTKSKTEYGTSASDTSTEQLSPCSRCPWTVHFF